MPPFVEDKHLTKKDSQDSEGIEEFNYEVSLLVAAKQSKLSFEELNLLTLNDFFNYLDMFVGEKEDDEKPRIATQEDIDNFYRYM